MHVLRAQEDKVRLRLFSVHRKDYRIICGDANVGMKVFGMNILGKDLEAFASMQLAEFGIHKESGDVFLVDYVFDLKSPGNESLKFDWGNIRQSQIYEELLYLQSMMNERTTDLRDSVVDRNISQGMDGNLEEVVRSPAAAQSSIAHQNKLFEALYD